MSSEPYLIAHLVRGEPAFDIAKRVCEGTPPCQPNCGLWNGETCRAKEEDWWIIPTSGHRAWPYWQTPICPSDDYRTMYINDQRGHVAVDFDLPVCPPSLPDHYPINTKSLPTQKITEINLEELDL